MTKKASNKNDELSFEEELKHDVKKSSLGEWLLENSKLFFIVVGVLVVSALSAVWYNQWNEGQKEKSLNKIYQFSHTYLTEAETDKKDIVKDEDKMMKDFMILADNVSHKGLLVPLALELSKALKNKNFSLEVLEKVNGFVSNQHLGSGFLKVQMASFYEDTEKTEKAIKILSLLKATAPDFLKPYAYFNLGRLYKDAGQKNKAKSELEYLIEKFKDSSEAKLAEALLSEL